MDKFRKIFIISTLFVCIFILQQTDVAWSEYHKVHKKEFKINTPLHLDYPDFNTAFIKILSLPSDGTLKFNGNVLEDSDIKDLIIRAPDYYKIVYHPGDFTGITSFEWQSYSYESNEGGPPCITYLYFLIEDNSMPVVFDISKGADEDTVVLFTKEDFQKHFEDSDGDELKEIRISGLNSLKGTLELSGDSVAEGDIIEIDNINNLTYNPDANWFGITEFEWVGFDAFHWAEIIGSSADTAKVHIRIDPINDPPVIDCNREILCNHREETIITSLDLSVSDVDTDSSNLIYTLTRNVESGELKNNGIVMNIDDTFTQDDIDNNKISYRSFDNDSTSDSFSFTINDNDGGAIAETSFDIAINHAPTLSEITQLNNAFEDTPFTISFDDLEAAANENDINGDTIRFRVEAVTCGMLTKNGVEITPGITTIKHGENMIWTPPANLNGVQNVFSVVAYDGTLVSALPLEVKINLEEVNDIPVIVRNLGASVLQGEQVTITDQELQITDLESGPDSLIYTICDLVLYGTLKRDEIPLRIGDTFSQIDINNNRIHYVHNNSRTQSDKFKFSISDGEGGQLGIGDPMEFLIDMNLKSDNAALSRLMLNKGTLNPEFKLNIYEYNVRVDRDTTEITITPTVANQNSVVTVNDEVVESGNTSNTIHLYSGSNEIIIQIMAEDSITTKTYKIIVYRKKPSSSNTTSSLVQSITGSLTGNQLIPMKLNKETGILEFEISSNELKRAFRAVESLEQIKVDMPPEKGVKEIQLTLLRNALVEENENREIIINTPLGNIAMKCNMFPLGAQEANENITLIISKVNTSQIVDQELRRQIGNRPIIELMFSSRGDRVVWDNPNSPVKICIPYTPTKEETENSEFITVWYIDGSGNSIAVPSGKYDPETGMVTFTTTHFSRYAVVHNYKIFDDLPNNHKMKHAIEVLASKGIIKGITDMKYMPDQAITRAEYLHYLMNTLGLTAAFEENFNDVEPGAYYYKTIGMAKKLEIAFGLEDNMYHPSEKITRQDMMVLTARTLEKFKSLKSTETSAVLDKFKDKDIISDYAKQSLATLVKEGLIIGSGNKINPLANTTRAEAAVFLYRIYNK